MYIYIPHTIAFINLTMKLLTFSISSDCKLRAKMEFLLSKALAFAFIALLADDHLKSSPCRRSGGAGGVPGFAARFWGDVLPEYLAHMVPWSWFPLGICRSCWFCRLCPLLH